MDEELRESIKELKKEIAELKEAIANLKGNSAIVYNFHYYYNCPPIPQFPQPNPVIYKYTTPSTTG